MRDPRNDADYDTWTYGTEPIPGDGSWRPCTEMTITSISPMLDPINQRLARIGLRIDPSEAAPTIYQIIDLEDGELQFGPDFQHLHDAVDFLQDTLNLQITE
jgi:hypothetical protein